MAAPSSANHWFWSHRQAPSFSACEKREKEKPTAGGHVLEHAADEQDAEAVGRLEEDGAEQRQQLHVRRGGLLDGGGAVGAQRGGALDVRAGELLAEHRVVGHHGEEAEEALQGEEEVLAVVLHGGLLVGDEHLLQTRLEHLEEVEVRVANDPVQVLYASLAHSEPTVHHRADRRQAVHEGGREVDAGPGGVHDLQLVHVAQAVLPVSPAPRAYRHELAEVHHDVPRHHLRQLRVAHLRVYASRRAARPTRADHMAVGVEKHRQQRVLVHARVRQLDHRLQRVVALQLLLHQRVAEEVAEEVHDQLGGRRDHRLLALVATHRLLQVVRALAVGRRRRANVRVARGVGLQTGVQAVDHAHPHRIDRLFAEGGDLDLHEDRAQNNQCGVHNDVVVNNMRAAVPKKNLREEMEDTRSLPLLELQNCLQWNQLCAGPSGKRPTDIDASDKNTERRCKNFWKVQEIL